MDFGILKRVVRGHADHRLNVPVHASRWREVVDGVLLAAPQDHPRNRVAFCKVGLQPQRVSADLRKRCVLVVKRFVGDLEVLESFVDVAGQNLAVVPPAVEGVVADLQGLGLGLE